MAHPRAITTSSDGLWTAIRRGTRVELVGTAPPTSVDGEPRRGPTLEERTLELPTDDAEIHLVGPPTLLVATLRAPAPGVLLVQPPTISRDGDATAAEVLARLPLDEPMRVAAVTGQRLALVSADARRVSIVRAAGKALTPQAIDPGSAVELIVGLEKNQFLFALHRKLEIWDAVSGRPLLRMQLQLPPPPRNIGAAHGHLWVTRPGSEEVMVYRLSDGRPFRHYAGAPVLEVICHPGSPLVVLVTPRFLVRLNCFAHSLTIIEAPWTPGTPLALLGTGEDMTLVGLGDAEAPWHVHIGVAGTPVPVDQPDHSVPPAATLDVAPAPVSAGDRMRALRERASERASERADRFERAGRETIVAEASPAAIALPARPPVAAAGGGWRAALAAGQSTVVAHDGELDRLAEALALSSAARHALAVLYGHYLNGTPRLSLAALAAQLDDWREALGQGELASFALLRRKRGTVGLRRSVTDFLDGAPPRHVRLVEGTGTPISGAHRVPRDGKSDAALERELADQLGRLAIIAGDPDRALLEARLHGATAVAFAPPEHRPRPWPRGAGLVLVLYGSATSWVADLPALPATSS